MPSVGTDAACNNLPISTFRNAIVSKHSVTSDIGFLSTPTTEISVYLRVPLSSSTPRRPISTLRAPRAPTVGHGMGDQASNPGSGGEGIRGCIQKFPDWPPGTRIASGTALCPLVQLYRYFVGQSSDFCRHNPLCCSSTSVYHHHHHHHHNHHHFVIDSGRKLLDIHSYQMDTGCKAAGACR